ncbi:hypothetical protein FOC1_g10003407, partial [Fusarium oxysporum f. sp. cubense race 1]
LVANATSSRGRVVLAEGYEGSLHDEDVDLRDPNNWLYERPRISNSQWFPGPGRMPSLARLDQFGHASPQSGMSLEVTSTRALFSATNDHCYAQGSLIISSESRRMVLEWLRGRYVDEATWDLTERFVTAHR